jgi:branched-chain amino acid transport system permease protein
MESPQFRAIRLSVLLLLALAAPFAFYPIFVMKALCFGLFAAAFNLLIGYGGLLSFGHAAFMGSASYITAYTVKMWGFPPLVGILAGTAVAAAMGTVFGWLAIRRKGIYFAMVTLALSQMVYFFALEVKFTGGEDGIQAVPRGNLFGLIDLNQPLAMYYLVLAIFLIGFGIVYRAIHSPFGEVLKAIRDNEPRAISLGYNTDRYKLLAFILSATLAGLAGATKALVFQFASLTDVTWQMSGDVVLMTLVGGLGTIWGPVAGAFISVTMENYLAQFGSWVTVIQGAIFVVCVLLFRRGVVGEINYLIARRRGNPPLAKAAASD